ncbi:hypothetical protein [Desulfosporosinus hippei]|nr:hypothetical protein [Desulfosporosinus hippei]
MEGDDEAARGIVEKVFALQSLGGNNRDLIVEHFKKDEDPQLVDVL